MPKIEKNSKSIIHQRIHAVCFAEGKPTCKVNGICGSDISSGIDIDEVEDEEIVDPNPVIQRMGPERIEIDQGTSFAKCPENAPLNLLCDRGAEAWDSLDGVLTARIELCSSDSKRIRYRYINTLGGMCMLL